MILNQHYYLIIRLQQVMFQFQMNNYPLSAKSSKKAQYSPSSFKNSILDKSACQNFDTKQLNKQDYQHILIGERIFIQLYYRGNITQTAYDQYIPFMGGTIYKRLNPKITIFLTNPDEKQIRLILERVKKVCPNCKVISILWFQQCFRQKKKIPFDQFIIESKPQKIQQQEGSKTKKIENQLQQFLKNIGQDVQTDFQEFQKYNPSPYFEILNKNHNINSQQLFPSTVFELPPNKRQRQKQQNNKKKRKGSAKIQKTGQFINQARESKSIGGQALKKVRQQVKTQDNNEFDKQIAVDKEDTNKNEMKPKIINSLMQKYLTKEEDIKQEDDNLTVTVQNMDNLQKKEIQLIRNTATKSQQKNSKNSNFYSQVYKKSKIIETKKNKINSQCENRFTFSNRGSYYKNIPIKMPVQLSELVAGNTKQRANSLHEVLCKKVDNRLNVITSSKLMAQKISQINRMANEHRSITFELITIQAYLNYINIFKKTEHEIFYLLNIKKLEDKVLYYYLTINNPHSPHLISCRLIQEIYSYNNKIKEPNFKSPLKLSNIKFRFMNKINFQVNKKEIMNKKIVFLQSSIDKEVIKKIMNELEAILITPEQYLMGKKPDLIVTNKFGLPQKGVKTIKQDQLWSMLLKFQGQGLYQ